MPCFFAGAFIDELHLETAALAPPHVHAEQHRGPILAFGAARARVDFDIRVHGIGFARQQSFDALSLHLFVEALQGRFAFRDGALVAFGLAKLDERQVVFELAFETAEVGEGGFQELALAHQLLRSVRVVPKARIFGAAVQVLEAGFGLFRVKDASSRGRAPL